MGLLELLKPRPNDQALWFYAQYINYLDANSKLSRSHEINTSGPDCKWQISKEAVRSTALSFSSRVTRTDAGDHHSRGRYLKPGRRNDSAERKTSRSRCCPWRHTRRWRRAEPMPGRLRPPALAGRHSERPRWDGRTRTRPGSWMAACANSGVAIIIDRTAAAPRS